MTVVVYSEGKGYLLVEEGRKVVKIRDVHEYARKGEAEIFSGAVALLRAENMWLEPPTRLSRRLRRVGA
jgi:hypothetical protein